MPRTCAQWQDGTGMFETQIMIFWVENAGMVKTNTKHSVASKQISAISLELYSTGTFNFECTRVGLLIWISISW